MGTTNWAAGQRLLRLAALLLVVEACRASVQHKGSLSPGFKGTPMYWVDHDGVFLLSNGSIFGLGLTTTNATLSYRLVVVHLSSSTVVWSANRDSPATNQDVFAFDDSGNAYLQSSGGSMLWSTNSGDKGVSAMELWDSGNLVLVGKDRSIIWQSFSFPTDTLLSNQKYSEGMNLSSGGPNGLNYTLRIEPGNMVLSASFDRPQPYWSAGSDSRMTQNMPGNSVASAVLVENSWNFYGSNGDLLWRFIFSDNTDRRATWAAVLGTDGSITFELLQAGSTNPSSTKIPQLDCDRPSACSPYHVCYPEGNTCQCPPSIPLCESTAPRPSCNETARASPSRLVGGGGGISYPALRYVRPSMVGTTLENCKGSCLGNCSCAAAFFDGDSGDCFFFEEMGSMVRSSSGNFSAYIKISSDGSTDGSNGNGNKKPFPAGVIAAIVLATLFVISGMVFAGFRIYKKSAKIPEGPDGSADGEEEEDGDGSLFEGLSGMPIRFAYKDLQTATGNFGVKLGRGGFGSVYKGTLPDGTQLAVKQLESIGQGKKEFRAEVSIIGSIHHLHLVRLKGFCAEGTHRLLAYEFMSNGSLDKWLFRKDEGGIVLDWETRYNIAIGTAKGLAYLHEDCDVKIVHCDIKPENVLLDDRFTAKVSDFGLAKLMSREQSHVFTTMRGTRGYLAPEWITNYAISEKSDVYSYGMVLLELIGGRKNYDADETSEKSHFPSYAFKMLEEGKVRDIIDARLGIDDREDERVGVGIRVALWCIQDDMHLRPSMAKVVQMLEGLCPVGAPPVASPLGSRIYANFMKSARGEGTTSSSGPSDCNSDTYISAVRLSGPR